MTYAIWERKKAKCRFSQLKVARKPHLHGRLFCNAIRRFFMGENLSRRAVTHTRRDSLAAIAFEKNRRRVSKAAFTRATFLRAIFWYKWMWQSCIYSIMVLIVIKVTVLLKMTVSSCFHSDSDILNLFIAKSEQISLRFFIATPILF